MCSENDAEQNISWFVHVNQPSIRNILYQCKRMEHLCDAMWIVHWQTRTEIIIIIFWDFQEPQDFENLSFGFILDELHLCKKCILPKRKWSDLTNFIFVTNTVYLTTAQMKHHQTIAKWRTVLEGIRLVRSRTNWTCSRKISKMSISCNKTEISLQW